MSKIETVGDWICCRVADCIVRVVSCVRKPRREQHGKRIVFVYANDLLGDTIVKIPFFIALRKEFPPEAFKISMVLSPSTAHIVKGLGCVDEIIEETPLHWNHSIFWVFTKGQGFLTKSLRWACRHKADIAIVCHRSRSLGCDFAMRLSSPSTCVAYTVDANDPMLPMSAKYQVKHYDRQYTHMLPHRPGRHQIDEMAMLLSLAAGRNVVLSAPKKVDVLPCLDFTVADKLPSVFSVVVLGARVKYRMWPLERFVELAKHIEGPIVVVGSADESLLADSFKKGCCFGENVVDLCGKTTLPQLGGVLIRARMVITNETGTANYAAIIGAHTVCILGGGDFGAFMPNKYCSNSICVYKVRSCFNCGWKCCEKDFAEDRAAPCIMDITVGDVIEAIRARSSSEVLNLVDNRKSGVEDK